MNSASRRYKFYLFILLVFCFARPADAPAASVEQRTKIGAWTLYCIKGPDKPTYSDCSIAAGVSGANGQNEWAKIAISPVSPKGDMQMTIMIPRLDYFRQGISIGVDGRQVGISFIETCKDLACESTVILDDTLYRDLSTGQKATFQYQIGENESLSLALNIEDFVEAVGVLQQRLV